MTAQSTLTSVKNIGEGRLMRLLRFIDGLTQSRRMMALLAAVTLFSCALTYGVMAHRTGNINTAYWLLNLDLVLLLGLGTLVARHIVRIWTERKRGIAGSRLHVRLVAVFSVLATVPAILMAVFSSIFLYFGVHAWFNHHVSTAIRESQAVAQAYLKEHQQVMRADVLAMANDLNREAIELMQNPRLFSQVVDTQSMLRNLSEAIIVHSDGKVVARSHLSFSLEMDTIPEKLLRQADQGDVVLLTDEGDRIRALVKLDRFFDTYLYVGRLVDAAVLQHMRTTQTAVSEYNTLEQRQTQMQITTTAMFVAVALLLLLAAVWFGLTFSERLVAPISALILATEKVRMGDMDARVTDTQSDDEIGMLGRAFNRMTDQIQSQQTALIAANRMLDERRRFTEAILSGASSGVIGLDNHGRITLANAMAEELLQGVAANDDGLSGLSLGDFIPESEEVLQKALAQTDRAWPLQLEYAVGSGPRKTLLLRITAEQGGHGAVATIDDISALVSAQRKAAWADVARRIAHEIKNPLTPIQLSAERLRRKYLPQIHDDPETFEKCTETIIRQVGDIGHMVSEFSAYARMPVPVKNTENIVAICQDALVLQRQAYPDIGFGFISSEPLIEAVVDRLQLTQVMTNLLQNAIDSIHDRQQVSPGDGRVKVVLDAKDGNIIISVEDNGTGLPEKVRDQILEPYVTTKKKGSGLGLAIVKKIMEDHDGSVILEDNIPENAKSGAKAVIVFPKDA
ncbi:MAG: HAMP domain-containing protein [Alphaproteobacteria bacterium]|nr:HAMP domain-containing protein [Alphaproteobacteria bacterium]